MIHCIAFRHGQTDWNLSERIQGHSDIPINQNGYQQALKTKKDIANKIGVDIIYSSNLIRCVETAKIIFPNRPIIQTKLLREINFGIYEGQNRWEVRRKSPFFNNIINNSKHPLHLYTPFPKGESCVEAFLRLLNLLIEIDSKYINKNIALVTHGDLLELIFEINLMKIPEIKHGSFFEFDFDSETMSFLNFTL